MNKNIIYHNPRCSKSRETLALLKERGVEVEVIEYSHTPPSVDELKKVCEMLKVKALDIIRIKDKLFDELNLDVSDKRSEDEWFKILNLNPSLLERPIVIYKDKAIIGRPPERVLKIIG